MSSGRGESATVRAFELGRLIQTPVAAIRPYLAFKGTLILLAFDMWLTRVGHAGRYGAGGFNVAHWPWLDWVQPAISPAAHVGALVACSALCFAIAFAHRPPRWLIGLTFLIHSWAWAMSMLDSYQHHYLLSLVLLIMAFFPPLSADEALAFDAQASKTAGSAKGGAKGKSKRGKSKKRAAPAPSPTPQGWRTLIAPHPHVSAWAYSLLCMSIAVVYGYTAFSKSDPEWLSGAAFRRVLHYPATGVPADDPLSVFRSILEPFQLTGDEFWYAMGHSVVLVQVVCCAGYFLSPWRDATRSWITKAFFWVALFTALSFHVGAEIMSLEIGWFSYYMIGYALICMLPAQWLVVVARIAMTPRSMSASTGPALTIALRLTLAAGLATFAFNQELWILAALGASIFLAAGLRYFSRAMWLPKLAELPAQVALAVVAVAAVALIGAGLDADVPGTREGVVLIAVLLAIGTVYGLITEGHARAMYGYACGLLYGAVALYLCFNLSEVRWEYWRMVGGDHRRREDYVTSYRAYVKANEYAPEGEDRREQQEAVRQILIQRGLLPDGPGSGNAP